jgi:uracil-DNA glycosylase
LTEAILKIVTRERDPVFLLWGRHAIDLESIIREAEGSSDRLIRSSHPSPLAARRGSREHPAFLDTDPFVEANDMLNPPIEWCPERHRHRG